MKLNERLVLTCAAAVILLAACGGASNSEPPTRAVVAHETTRDIVVWEPAGEGPWPVVYLAHGRDGDPDTVALLGERLAAEGHVVFAPTWVLDDNVLRDLECGYRFVRSIAAEHGGDLTLPVAAVGHMAGAGFAIGGTVLEGLLGPGGLFQDCFEGAPRPDVAIGIAPCEFTEDLSSGGNTDAAIVVVSPSGDSVCGPRENGAIVARLVDAGYDARLVTIDEANHWTPVFRDLVNGRIVDTPDADAGEETLRTIVDAIEAVKS